MYLSVKKHPGFDKSTLQAKEIKSGVICSWKLIVSLNLLELIVSKRGISVAINCFLKTSSRKYYHYKFVYFKKIYIVH